MQQTSPSEQEILTIADIVGVYGIKGWVKLRVRLDEPDLLSRLPSLQLRYPEQLTRRAHQSVTIEKVQRHGKGYIAQLASVTDRTTAESRATAVLSTDSAFLTRSPVAKKSGCASTLRQCKAGLLRALR